MINFLPTIYEDELLYSVFARYKRMCGMVSNEALIKDLFGRHIIQRSIFFPQNINTFIINLTPLSKITTKQLIMENTMFPFYTAFMSEEKSNAIYISMAEGCGRGIETIIGFGGSKVNPSNYLRYCPICFQEDVKNLGESYWRRIHQVVGAMYCRKHKVLLKDSTVLSTGNGLGFICADEEVCNEEIQPDVFSLRTKELNLKYLIASERLLHGGFERKGLDHIIRFYINQLRTKGLASKGGSLYISEVQEHFLKFYPDEYLDSMQSNFDPNSDTNWIRVFVRSNRKNRTPLRHLLYLQFLGFDPKDLFEGNEVEGKRTVSKKHSPHFEINERRAKWLSLIEENKGATRIHLKEIGKGLYSWIFKHDREWYEKVTPRVEVRRNKKKSIDWDKRDRECFQLAKGAVEELKNGSGKPIRVTPLSIRRNIGARNWFNNKKLIQTQQYLKESKEEINKFRIRKIKWAIDEMIKSNENITEHKIQLFAGFGGDNKVVRTLIESVIEEYK